MPGWPLRTLALTWTLLGNLPAYAAPPPDPGLPVDPSLAPGALVSQVGEQLRLSHAIRFEPNGGTLEPSATVPLDALAAYLAANDEIHVLEVAAHVHMDSHY